MLTSCPAPKPDEGEKEKEEKDREVEKGDVTELRWTFSYITVLLSSRKVLSYQ